MKSLSEKKLLKILLGLGGCIVAMIIYLLIFAFDTEIDKRHDKIGFIILGDINEAGWNASHYNGIKAACEEYGLQLLIRDHVKEFSGQCPVAIEELIAEGAGAIFLVSFNYASEVRSLIDKYPHISFINTSTLEHAKNLTSCFARMYQGRYLSGVLAGMKTKSNIIGYVAAMPNAEVCRGINAFTLGVQRTNPNAKVLVMWTGDWQVEDVEAEHAQILIEKYGADLLTYHQDVDITGQVAEKYGVDFIAYNAHLEGFSEHYLASVICRWDLYYKDILQKYMKGELFSIRDNWVGVQQGVITLSDYSESITPKMRSVVNSAQNELLYNNNLIFCDEIYDNQGKLRCGKNQVIDDKILLSDIDWLVKGVEVVE
ncbi:MAG: BMP family ABC transporter substrate-binding protein [Selenomonadaceae bacterium]|nr:BMP family ABC transporter substrate-binding protein [Selenomonadaceae bacterium]